MQIHEPSLVAAERSSSTLKPGRTLSSSAGVAATGVCGRLADCAIDGLSPSDRTQSRQQTSRTTGKRVEFIELKVTSANIGQFISISQAVNRLQRVRETRRCLIR